MMALFKNTKKEVKKESGNIPETLGINPEKASQIIDAVGRTYHEKRGNINKIFDEIKAEKLTKNEAIFAYYVVGGVKFMECHEEVDQIRCVKKEIDSTMEIIKRLEKLIGKK